MFESLRKKISSWIGKEEKPKKAKKVSKKASKKDKSSKVAKASKKAKKDRPEVKVSKSKVKETKDIVPVESSEEEEELIEEEEKLEEEAEEESAEVEENEIEAEKEDPEVIIEEQAKETGVSEEELKEELEIEEKPKKEGFFSKLAKKFSAHAITKEDFEELFEELEITLLENNVALEVVDKIRETLSKNLIGVQIKKEQFESKVVEGLKEAIMQVLIEPPNFIEQVKSKKDPYVILFFGINGTGKTTSIAKIANMLKKQGVSCVLAAADTFRAASIEQLKTHADKIGVPIVAQTYGADPAAVAFDAIQYAKKNNIKVVLIDTAGRMYTKANLLKEMEKIIRISKPDLKIFVGESITGNDATDQAKTFAESAGIDGIILSKADIDEKAGTILSVSYVTNKPIYFLGTGQKYEDLQVFTKETVLKNLGLD